MLKSSTLLASAIAILLTLTALAPLAAYGATAPEGNADRGALLYESRCIGCHSLEANRIGPRHNDVFGRQIGSLTDYDYSPALAQTVEVWDSASLDRWLADPEAFLPGQRMNFAVAEAQDRRDLIAFLKREAQD